MCGICGIARLGSEPLDPGNTLVREMCDRIAHRGPDDQGQWCDEWVALGSRRLSVIDLSRNGRMPMANEDGSVLITYNGEVYNFRELAARYRLEERHDFRSRTDTEVILHLYEERGLDMLSELDGMFGLAIWDRREGRLHLARDRYGIKPLFWQRDDEFFRFGSEIKAILADPRVCRRPSIQALHDFLTLAYIPGTQTAFEDVHELAPAHVLSLVPETGDLRIRRYWRPDYTPDDSLDETAVIDRARELMRAAVERQLVADVPVGVLLSGGMDSSSIVALMPDGRGEPLRTYAIGFEETSFNELPYAREVARAFGTTHREITITPERVRAMLPAYLRYIDEPYADGSAIPTYYVCGMAREDVVVVLSGEGGDEIFAGYDTYKAHRMNEWFRRVPRWVRHGLIRPLVERLPVSDRKLSFEFKAKRFLGGQELSPAEAHLWWRIVLTEQQKLGLYAPEVGERLALEPAARHFERVYAGSAARDTLSRLLEIDCSLFLPDDLMIKNDRMSMAHSLEARVPFTDNRLSAFMASVPHALKLKRMQQKYVMRRAMDGILPDRIVRKKKVGLEMPYSRWFKHDLRPLLDDYLGRDRLEASGLFQAERVRALVDDHLEARHDHGRALWSLVNYMMWHDLYVGERSPA